MCFCKILSDNELYEDVKRYRLKNNLDAKTEPELYYSLINLNKRDIYRANKAPIYTKRNIKIYKRNILNKWHLLIRLSINKELIKYRKNFKNLENQ